MILLPQTSRLCWARLSAAAPGGFRWLRIALLGGAILLFGLAGAMSARADGGAEIVEVEPVELLTAEELAELVALVALYPDDLLAIVLPASTYPLQIVLAARFLEARELDPELEPDEGWDASIVALLNYPEIIKLLSDELKWAGALGEAVLLQEKDVVAAVAAFRKQAAAVGNLQSDDKQLVSKDATGAIEITPVEREVIYVPYYDPQEVVVYQPRRAYYYYPRAYPVYYYPYPSGHYFTNGMFWGVTSAFSIGWRSHSLHWHHYGFRDHPYFGYSYYDPFYYRRPHLWLSYQYRNRLRGHHRRHHNHNRWHDDYRGRGRHGNRVNRPRRDNSADGGGRHSPDGRGRVTASATVAGRGVERIPVALPDKGIDSISSSATPMPRRTSVRMGKATADRKAPATANSTRGAVSTTASSRRLPSSSRGSGHQASPREARPVVQARDRVTRSTSATRTQTAAVPQRSYTRTLRTERPSSGITAKAIKQSRSEPSASRRAASTASRSASATRPAPKPAARNPERSSKQRMSERRRPDR